MLNISVIAICKAKQIGIASYLTAINCHRFDMVEHMIIALKLPMPDYLFISMCKSTSNVSNYAFVEALKFLNFTDFESASISNILQYVVDRYQISKKVKRYINGNNA